MYRMVKNHVGKYYLPVIFYNGREIVIKARKYKSATLAIAASKAIEKKIGEIKNG